jgi:putative ABC transport system permease protein
MPTTLKYALLSLKRSPRFSVPSVLMLASGIALSGICYAILEATVFRALPYSSPNRLVHIFKQMRREGTVQANLSRADFEILKSRAHSFEDVGYEFDMPGSLTEKSGHAIAIQEAKVSPRLLNLLGLRPRVGRLFESTDFNPNSAGTALVSYNFWVSGFAQDPAILGKHLIIDGHDSTVVGVLPETVRKPISIGDVWIADQSSAAAPDSAANSDKYVIARLRDPLSISAANREIAKLQPIRIPGLKNPTIAADNFRLVSLVDQVLGPAKHILELLMCACLTIQLLACINVGHLLVARRISRTRDVGIRLALGSGMARLHQEILFETLAIVLLALLCAVIILMPALPAASAVASAALHSTVHARLDPPVIAFCVLLGLGSCLFCSTIPILLLRHVSALSLINARWETAHLSLVASRLQDLFILAQIAAALVLTLGFGLLLKSIYHLSSVSLGFESNHLSYVLFDRGSASFPASELRLHEVLHTLSRISWVKSTALSSTPILAGVQMGLAISAEADDGGWIDLPPVALQSVSGSYFEALQIPVLSGRTFNDHDVKSMPCVAVVNRSFARVAWSTDNPVGRQIDPTAGFANNRQPCEIVGMVGDTRDIALARPPQPELFFSDLQHPAAGNAVVVVRTMGRHRVPSDTIRRLVSAVDPSRSMLFSADVGALVDTALSPATTRLQVFGGLAFAALLLALGGMYAAATFGLSLRTQEIGIRIAMGATLAQIISLVYRHYIRLAALGSLLGVALGASITRFFTRGVKVFEVDSYDPSVFFFVTVFCTGVVLASVILPVLRAIKVDPSQLLRAAGE